MDAVDRTLIAQLKDIGCSSCDEEVSSLEDLSPEQVMSCALFCLRMILPEESVMPKDPGSNMNMATKYNLASFLTTSCKDLGFRGDLGYQSFLYGTTADVRRVFLFLIEKLPREETHDSPKKSLTVDDKIRRSSEFSRVWMPPEESTWKSREDISTLSLSNLINSRSVVLNKMNPTKKRYYDKYLDIPFHDLASILAWNRRQLSKQSSSPYSVANTSLEVTRLKPQVIPRSRSHQSLKSSPIKEPKTSEAPHEDVEQPSTKSQIDILHEDLSVKSEELKAAEQAIKTTEKSIAELNSLLKEQNLRLLELKSKNLTIEELKQLTDTLQAENDELKSKWHDMKSVWLQEISSLTKKSSELELEQQELKRTLVSKRRDLTMKQQLLQDLKSKIPDPFPATRAAYTKRIMEILNNIKKLDVDAKKVISDTRILQKEITLLTGKVQRSFSVADEAVFSSAKQKTDDFSRRSYKLLAQVHEETSKLSAGIETYGLTRREVIGLEESVQKQQASNIDSKLQKIQADILQVRQTNQSLMQNLQD